MLTQRMRDIRPVQLRSALWRLRSKQYILIFIQALALALYEDALGDDVDTGEINIDQLRNALEKHDGLLENLTMR